MWIVVVYSVTQLPEVFGPFHEEREADEFQIKFQSQTERTDLKYLIDTICNPSNV